MSRSHSSSLSRRTLRALIALGTLGILTGALSSVAPAQDGADSLQRELGDEIASHWIYGDWEAARAKAAREKKPIFLLFR